MYDFGITLRVKRIKPQPDDDLVAPISPEEDPKFQIEMDKISKIIKDSEHNDFVQAWEAILEDRLAARDIIPVVYILGLITGEEFETTTVEQAKKLIADKGKSVLKELMRKGESDGKGHNDCTRSC